MAADSQSDNQAGNDTLDDFFNAASANRASGLRQAAEQIRGEERTAGKSAALDEEAARFARKAMGGAKNARNNTNLATPEDGIKDLVASLGDDSEDETTDDENLDGKFIALDPDAIPGMEKGDPFVLVPANVHAHVPWWGWTTIAAGLAVFVAAVVLLPGISLSRLASRLGDKNEATVRQAMRQLVVNGDARTVRKLYDMASSPGEGLTARLRAVDTMSLIERVPEVDSALLRLELSGSTHDQVREAATAARKQREAYRTRQVVR